MIYVYRSWYIQQHMTTMNEYRVSGQPDLVVYNILAPHRSTMVSSSSDKDYTLKTTSFE